MKLKSKLIGSALLLAPLAGFAQAGGAATDGAGGAIQTASGTIGSAVTNNVGLGIGISILLLSAVVAWRSFKRLTAK